MSDEARHLDDAGKWEHGALDGRERGGIGGSARERARRICGKARRSRRESREVRREARRAHRAARRDERARERANLMQLPARDRLRVWWRTRPLGVTFTVYLAGYLAVATVISVLGVNLFSELYDEYYYRVEVDCGDGSTLREALDSGPYIYDAQAGELRPAAEIDFPGDEPYAVFIATGARGVDGASVPAGGAPLDVAPATIEMVREGKVCLYDWGLNYNDWYPQDEVLGDDRGITYENLARYDALSREHRLQTVEMFGKMTGADLERTFGAGQVSNTAYYATPARDGGIMPLVSSLMVGSVPVLTYGGLGWLMFRRFYRVHISGPLAGLGGAAERIAGQDLDFSIEHVRGRELGRLSETLENMRASLLDAQRELWRTAEGRRRLNAAFAHDLRTPITVLKGTVEMASMRLRRGEELDEGALGALSAQVARLERYASEMGGLSKLEDRPVERTLVPWCQLQDELAAHARNVVAARGEGLEVRIAGVLGTGRAAGSEDAPQAIGMAASQSASQSVKRAMSVEDVAGFEDIEGVKIMASGENAEHAGSTMGFEDAECAGGAPASGHTLRPGDTACVDVPLVEEVLNNLLSNACGHARTVIEVEIGVRDGMLRLSVKDDGPGFTPEALHRGCDPFYSENKSAEHFGLGLNVSSILCGLHGGALELSNVDAGGACVTASFAADMEGAFLEKAVPALKTSPLIRAIPSGRVDSA